MVPILPGRYHSTLQTDLVYTFLTVGLTDESITAAVSGYHDARNLIDKGNVALGYGLPVSQVGAHISA